MQKYIDRLMKCGYSFDNARKICQDFQKDFSIIDLENFVLTMEKEHLEKKNVDKI